MEVLDVRVPLHQPSPFVRRRIGANISFVGRHHELEAVISEVDLDVDGDRLLAVAEVDVLGDSVLLRQSTGRVPLLRLQIVVVAIACLVSAEEKDVRQLTSSLVELDARSAQFSRRLRNDLHLLDDVLLVLSLERDDQAAANEDRLAEREHHEASQINLVYVLNNKLFILEDLHGVLSRCTRDLLRREQLDEPVASRAVD